VVGDETTCLNLSIARAHQGKGFGRGSSSFLLDEGKNTAGTNYVARGPTAIRLPLVL
jgi:hypothetical protein